MIADRLGVDARSVHGSIIGEHGDSSVACWSNLNVAGVRLRDVNPVVGRVGQVRATSGDGDDTSVHAVAVVPSDIPVVLRAHSCINASVGCSCRIPRTGRTCTCRWCSRRTRLSRQRVSSAAQGDPCAWVACILISYCVHHYDHACYAEASHPPYPSLCVAAICE